VLTDRPHILHSRHIRKEEAQIGPIRVAVMKHPRNTDRIRIACMNEEELKRQRKRQE
jgi:hypothetical protein